MEFISFLNFYCNENLGQIFFLRPCVIQAIMEVVT